MKVEVSNGEVVDKITILKIKLDKIEDYGKLENVKKEYRILSPYMESFEVRREFENLYAINLLLWEVEDDIREKEKIEEFDEEFISLARKVYRLNDERARIKKTINEKTGSELVEEKSYKEWE
jgi:hypothetical protein|tara:strand:- start:250 stop:618 length:369 start_codon:yes stop_codon:yes gene_type:complete